MVRREPAVIASAIAAILQAAILLGWLPQDFESEKVAQALVILITVVVGPIIRSLVIPVRTIKDAGLHPDQVNQVAKNPNLQYAGDIEVLENKG